MDFTTLSIVSLLYVVPWVFVVLAAIAIYARRHSARHWQRWEWIAAVAPLITYIFLIEACNIDRKGFSVLWELVLLGALNGAIFAISGADVFRNRRFSSLTAATVVFVCIANAIGVGLLMPGFSSD